MNEKESIYVSQKSVTCGPFEFTSVRLPNSEVQEVAEYAQNHIVLHSIELQSERGSVPLLPHYDDSYIEASFEDALHSSAVVSREQFLAQLEKQAADGIIMPPKSLAELSYYRCSSESRESRSKQAIDVEDGTMVQLLAALTELPPEFRQDLLNFVKAVEEKHKSVKQKEAMLRESTSVPY